MVWSTPGHASNRDLVPSPTGPSGNSSGLTGGGRSLPVHIPASSLVPASLPIFPHPHPCLSPTLPHFLFFPVPNPACPHPCLIFLFFPLPHLCLSPSMPHSPFYHCPHPCLTLVPIPASVSSPPFTHPILFLTHSHFSSSPSPVLHPSSPRTAPCLSLVPASCSLLVFIRALSPSLSPCPCIVSPSLSHVSMSLPHVLIPPHPIPACLLTPPLPTPGHARQRGTSPGNRGTCCGDRTPGTREGDSAPRPAPPSRAAPVRPSRSERHRRGPAVPAPLPWGLGRKVPKNRITSFRKSRDGSRAGKTSRAATGKKNAENIQNRETRINTLAYG